jgi:hypothetical protein
MYGRHYESTYHGSMRKAGAMIFAVWGYVVSHQKPAKDGNYYVELNDEELADCIGESVEKIREAITKLEEPDARSRTPDEEGRRIVKVAQFSYRVVNGAHYQRLIDDEARRAYWRERKAESRERHKSEEPHEPASAPPPESHETAPAPPAVRAIAPTKEEYVGKLTLRGIGAEDAGKAFAYWAQLKFTFKNGQPIGDLEEHLDWQAKRIKEQYAKGKSGQTSAGSGGHRSGSARDLPQNRIAEHANPVRADEVLRRRAQREAAERTAQASGIPEV